MQLRSGSPSLSTLPTVDREGELLPFKQFPERKECCKLELHPTELTDPAVAAAVGSDGTAWGILRGFVSAGGS